MKQKDVRQINMKWCEQPLAPRDGYSIKKIHSSAEHSLRWFERGYFSLWGYNYKPPSRNESYQTGKRFLTDDSEKKSSKGEKSYRERNKKIKIRNWRA